MYGLFIFVGFFIFVVIYCYYKAIVYDFFSNLNTLWAITLLLCFSNPVTHPLSIWVFILPLSHFLKNVRHIKFRYTHSPGLVSAVSLRFGTFSIQDKIYNIDLSTKYVPGWSGLFILIASQVVVIENIYGCV